MKTTIIILSIILALLLVLAGVVFFMDYEPQPEEPASELASQSTEPSSTQEPSTEAPTTEEPTEPPLEKTLQEPAVYLNGTQVESYHINGQHYISAALFAETVGLTLEGEEPVKLSGRLDTVEFSADGQSLTVNGETLPVTDGVLADEDGTYILFDDTAKALDYPIYVDDQTDITYITPSARSFEIPEDVNVPVLMYHAVSDNMWGIGELFVSPTSMEEQLQYLTENGYDAIWFEDLAHLEDYDKPVILTFDDGYDDNYTELFPLLQEYNVKATIFIIGNAPGTNHKMTEEQIKELSDSGLVSIQSHAYTHDDLDAMGEETLEFELGESKRAITRITGKEPSVLCYPTGKYSNLTLEVAARYYNFGLKMVGGLYNTSDDPFLVSRYYISRYTDIYTFAAYISDAGT